MESVRRDIFCSFETAFILMESDKNTFPNFFFYIKKKKLSVRTQKKHEVIKTQMFYLFNSSRMCYDVLEEEGCVLRYTFFIRTIL